MQTTKVSTKDIVPSPYNMRRTANDPVYEQKLHDLVKSISEKGILQPITVRKMDGHYETVFGNRRLEAAKRLKIASVDVQVGEFNDDDAFLANMTENIQREDTDPVDIANGIHRLHESNPIVWSYSAIGRALGKSRGWVFEMAKLTDRASIEVLNVIAGKDESGKVPKGKIDYRSALELTRKIPEQVRQAEVAHNLVSRDIKGLDARKIINAAARHPEIEIEDIVDDVRKQPAKLTVDEHDMQRIVQHKANGVTVQFLDPKVKENWPVDIYSRVESATVDKIIRKRVSSLNEIDAKVNGFKSVAQLSKELERKYGVLNDEDYIFTVHFRES